MTVKTKGERIQLADTLCNMGWVLHNQNLYMPVHSSLVYTGATPAPMDTIWVPHDMDQLKRHLNRNFDTEFENPTQTAEFYYLLCQKVPEWEDETDSILIRTGDGLLKLHADGVLREPDGVFTPNTLPVPLNDDPDVKAELLATITAWVGDSEEDATSLLRHLSTVLAPHWTSIKYILLLGDGRNGKSVLMEMLSKMCGTHNVSGVSRQDMAAKSQVISTLNGKLVNIVMDGQAEYLKDSGTEKTLIAGETAHVRLLYKNSLLPVRTNALFIEGLNKEPKSSDKSSALQARLVRFQFPNRYSEDWAFKQKMLSDKYVGALLALLIDHYVPRQDAHIMLAPTARQLLLQLGHQYENSHALQFVDFVRADAVGGEQSLIGMTLPDLVSQFMSWRVKAGDIRAWDEQSVRDLFAPVIEFTRKNVTLPDGRRVKIPAVKGFKPDTVQYLESMHTLMEESDEAAVLATVVED
jgi:phage/plasmid-associated DNA primase